MRLLNSKISPIHDIVVQKVKVTHIVWKLLAVIFCTLKFSLIKTKKKHHAKMTNDKGIHLLQNLIDKVVCKFFIFYLETNRFFLYWTSINVQTSVNILRIPF